MKRRGFLQLLGLGAAATAAGAVTGQAQSKELRRERGLRPDDSRFLNEPTPPPTFPWKKLGSGEIPSELAYSAVACSGVIPIDGWGHDHYLPMNDAHQHNHRHVVVTKCPYCDTTYDVLKPSCPNCGAIDNDFHHTHIMGT